MSFFKYIFFIITFSGISFTQIQQGGTPLYGLEKNSIDYISTKNLNIIDHDLHPMILKYADEFSVDINLPKLAKKVSNLNETIFYLGIQSDGAKALAFTFDQFHLTPNTKMFIYDEDKSMYIGAFNSKNNNPSGTLSTAVVKGHKVIIELSIPNDEINDLKLNLSVITHDFLDLMNFHNSRPNDRVDCNDNTACSSANDWGDQVDAVVLVSSNGGSCSAALVNNTAQDLTPYILYAAHCNSGGSSTVYFNYQSNTCSGNNSGNYNTMSGTQNLAIGNFNNNDYALIRLNNNIPNSYNPYYAGWNRSTSSPGNNVVGIHHPDGDIKKISYDAYGMSSNGNVWEFAFENGRVIPGSSGSPFFDTNKHIRGMASYIYTNYCDPAPDCYCSQSYYHGYAKFSSAWNYINNYLDPINANVTSLDGTRDGQTIIYGCTDNNACNFDSSATNNDGSCEYAQGSCNCNGLPTGSYCDCNFNYNDECDVCDGDGSSCASSVDLSFYNINSNAGTVDIIMQNDTPIAGFQFIISNTPDYLDLVDVSSGSSNNYNFTVSSTENGSIVGFSLTGSSIPEGQESLLTATFDTNLSGSLMVDLCLEDPVFSDSNAISVPVTIGPCAEMNFTNSLYGDINGDDIVNILDVVLLVNMVLGISDPIIESDLNNDNITNILDVVVLINIILTN